ncbi:hypothetical protein L1892_01115 [Gordonia sp. GW1C4-4]|uniref:Lipoprotein n=2 Tax=Gordonia tangerina TaxID=2911060 RepID=A0ABS9DED1_9ACTN|nr:hypothetical protein [Gordonia tangerina]
MLRRANAGRLLPLTGLGICSALLLVGCGGGTSNQLANDDASVSPETSTPAYENLQMRVRWSEGAESLATSEATFLRAVFESDAIATVEGSLAAAFPGYADALADPDTISRYESSGSPSRNHTIDYRAKIAGIDETAGRTAVALVCSAGRNAFADGEFPPMISASDPPKGTEANPGVMKVFFERGEVAPPEGQRGDATVPGANVFGDWKVTEIQRVWASDAPDRPDPRLICGDLGDLTEPGSSRPGWSAASGV